MRYEHRYGSVRVQWNARHGGAVALVLEAERTQGTDGQWMAYPRAIPDQAGIGATEEEALQSLDQVFQTWLQLFIESNGLEGFLRELEHFGFGLVPETIEPKTVTSAVQFQAIVPPRETEPPAQAIN